MSVIKLNLPIWPWKQWNWCPLPPHIPPSHSAVWNCVRALNQTFYKTKYSRFHQRFTSLFLKSYKIFTILYTSCCTQHLPAQHGIRLCSKDGGVHHKPRVVYNECDSLWSAHTASTFFGVFVNKHHFSRAHALKGALRAGQAAVATAGATGRDSLRSWAVRPWWDTLPFCTNTRLQLE